MKARNASEFSESEDCWPMYNIDHLVNIENSVIYNDILQVGVECECRAGDR